MILLLLLGLSSLVSSSSPPAESTQGQWTVLQNNGKPCIKFCATVELQLQYVDKNDAVVDVPMFLVPSNAIAATGDGKSSCEGKVQTGDTEDTVVDSQILQLDFPDNVGWNVRLAFTEDKRLVVNEGDYALFQVTVTANYSSMANLFPNSTHDHIHTYSSVVDFINPPEIAAVEYTAIGDSLYCPNSPQGFMINDDASVGPKAYLRLSDLWMQAYMDSDDFGQKVTCADDQNEIDLVPVIVSAVLAALVLFTLIAYFVYRSRLPTDILDTTQPEFEDEHDHAKENSSLKQHDNYGYEEEDHRF